MASWSKKIYLSFWLSLLLFTLAAVWWLPHFLDQGRESSIKPLDAAPKVASLQEREGRAITRFPTRPFLDAPPPLPVADQATPLSSAPPVVLEEPAGLPSRTVPGVDSGQALDERVTTRAYLAANSSVFAQPRTTATVLGRVGSETRVRWLASAGEGWEEILLKDGRSAYVQSRDLSFSSGSADDSSSFDRAGDGAEAELASLPSTVEGFLLSLSQNDLLRAQTYLSPLASGLSSQNLGGLAPYTGAPPLGRVLRIELASGRGPGSRTVRLVYGHNMEHEAATLWEWDRSQKRWMLVDWD